MAIELRLPRMSEEMQEGTVIRWLKQEGDAVAKGEPVVEVETEKVIVEVEAPEDGVLLQIVALDDTEGAAAPVSVQDTMRFLIELDDLMWRGRQDWRRAALMTMLGPMHHAPAE